MWRHEVRKINQPVHRAGKTLTDRKLRRAVDGEYRWFHRREDVGSRPTLLRRPLHQFSVLTFAPVTHHQNGGRSPAAEEDDKVRAHHHNSSRCPAVDGGKDPARSGRQLRPVGTFYRCLRASIRAKELS